MNDQYENVRQLYDKKTKENKELKRKIHNLNVQLLISNLDRESWKKLYEARDKSYEEASEIIGSLIEELDGKCPT